MTIARIAACIVPLIASAAHLSPALAQAYPSKPIQFIVSSAPGAGTDYMARAVADRLGPRLGTSLVVENRVGAGGVIAGQAAKRAAPDGYTLLSTASDLVFQIALGANKDVNVLTDFEPVILTVTNDFFLVVSGEALEAKSASDLVALARKRPGSLSYATPGVGAPHHLGMELFKQQTKTFIVHIPYKGMGPAMPDMLAGRVHATMTGYPAIAGHMKSGKLRILGVASPRRSAAQPDVPTLAEAGVPGVELQGFLYVVAPKGTPAAIVSRLNSEINQLLKTPELQAELATQSMTPAGGTPEQLAQKLGSEAKKWTAVAKAAGIKPE
jgi:tripartite-type tricarboxylate transporter receptor subunit TctC